MAAAILTAVALAGCEAPLGSGSTPTVFLEGDWRICQKDGAADAARTMRFYPDSYGLLVQTYGTADGTCGGAATGSRYEPWAYQLGDEVPASLGPAGTSVAARKIDIRNSFTTLYSIVYVDKASVPARMYFGDLTLDPALDGSAATKRPDVLSTASSFTGL